MEPATLLAEIANLPVEKRIELAQAIWDGVAAEHEPEQLSDELKRELDRRLADADANPDNVFTWDEVKEYVRRGKK